MKVEIVGQDHPKNNSLRELISLKFSQILGNKVGYKREKVEFETVPLFVHLLKKLHPEGAIHSINMRPTLLQQAVVCFCILADILPNSLSMT